MGYIISVYGENAFKKFLLPAIDNADYRVIIHKKMFHIKEDLSLDMEVINNHWYFKKCEKYQLLKNKQTYFETELRNNDIVQLRLKNDKNLTLLIYKLDTPFHIYQKYFIGNLHTITVGKGNDNLIRYDYFRLVSTHHAELQINEQECILKDLSENGTFINNIRVQGSQKLRFGDTINILGLQMVFLGKILAIEQDINSLFINEQYLNRVEKNNLDYFCANYKENDYKEKTFFHRVPRNIEKLDSEAVEIEAPPAAAQMKKQSAFLSIGPAFSMAIPMILGCAASIYASRSTGTSSVFMYTGIITAIGSAVVGSVWAALNVRRAGKAEKVEEMERQNAYVEYLKKTQARINEKYQKNKRILNTRYPSVAECATYNKDSTFLWNRNLRHPDFLFHRMGLGRIPFQVPISVPKEHFKVHKDELALKPQDIKASFEMMNDVPVGIDFLEHFLIGVIGGERKEGALKIARNLLIQIAANNSYTDVKIGVIYNREKSYEEECLSCTKWLPHTWSEDKKNRYVADNKTDAMDVLYEITNILREREENEKQKNQINRPYYVLFLTDMSILEESSIIKYAVNGKKEYGFSLVLLTEQYEDLPNACEYIVQNDIEFQGYYQVSDDISDRVPIRFDEIAQGAFEKFSRNLSAIEINEIEHGGEIPVSLTFLDMFGVKKIEQLDVLERWRKNRTYDSMKALIGQKTGNIPCYLDIHEKYHGPHGLIAGTTGSGKSETLQTYILSLAINYSPDDIGFFLIDYKGGGMANLFSDLPHTMGKISNLSGNQILRAMVSIKSENRRRQAIFNEYGVNNINNYTRLYKNKEASIPVPHLFIIIDEFAELKKEEPEFMKELISVAQVGRSLGVHLILATQKPSGTVDDNIWSNTKFRLCLRVQDKQDSNDMLHKPDAAYITQAGRCYLQVGNDEVYELFQSGWSGAVYDENDSGNEIARMCTITGKTALVGNRIRIRRKEEQKRNWIEKLVKIIQKNKRIVLEDEQDLLKLIFDELQAQQINYPKNEYNLRRMESFLTLYSQVGTGYSGTSQELAEAMISLAIRQGIRLPELKEKTQLDAVVDYLADLAKEYGYVNKFTLWLPILPESLYLSELNGYKQNTFDGKNWPKNSGAWKLEAFIGLVDDPVNQLQVPLLVNFTEGGHHAVCGTVVSGKSTFLQSLVYSMVHRYSPEYVNFYLLDFSSHMLGVYEGLDHVGGVIYENERDKLAKFFNLIRQITKERKEILKGGNYAQYVRAHGVSMPAIVIMIDQFSNFREKTNGIYEDELIEVSRNGVGYGIYLVLSSAGFGMMEIPSRIGANIRTVISLEMNDKYQYSEVLHTLKVPVYPESGVKGRGLVNRNGDILEFQTALSIEAEDDYSRNEKIVEECRRLNENWKGRKARPIPEIPENPILKEFMDLEETQNYLSDNYHLPFGYNQENATVYALDLRRIFCYLIQGKARSGKTNVVRVLASMSKKKGGNTALIDFSGSLHKFAEKNEIDYLASEHEIAEYWRGILPDIQKRNAIHKELRIQEADDNEIYERMCQEKAYYIFIDNLAEFVQKIYNPSDPADEMSRFLENITDKGRLYQIFFFVCIDNEKLAEISGYRIFENMARCKNGVHLGGNISAQRLLDFDYISFTEQTKIQKVGIGQLPSVEGEADVKTIVIPFDKKS